MRNRPESEVERPHSMGATMTVVPMLLPVFPSIKVMI